MFLLFPTVAPTNSFYSPPAGHWCLALKCAFVIALAPFLLNLFHAKGQYIDCQGILFRHLFARTQPSAGLSAPSNALFQVKQTISTAYIHFCF